MPRKTRREKYAAKLHKTRLQQSNIQSTSISVQIPSEQKNTEPVQKQPKKIHIDKPLFEDNIRQYFFIDFKKSLFVIASILLIEVVLYILNNTGMLKLIN